MHVEQIGQVEQLGQITGTITRADIEDLLFLEAELLDAWRLPEWLQLYTDEARYCVASPGLSWDASPDDNLFLINDDIERLRNRANRLQKRTAHSEYPHSMTMHLYSNVRLTVAPSAEEATATAKFLTTRAKDGVTDMFYGRLRYVVRNVAGRLRIHEKRCDLAMEALNPQGRVTILL
jgi:p-cumate 2,3-dioxygenase beta subunit